MRLQLKIAAGFLVAAGVWLLMASPVSAATITVTTTTDEFSDPGPGTGCSFDEAIVAANNNTSYGGCDAGDDNDDTIIVPAGTYSSYDASASIDRSVTILGDEAGGTVFESLVSRIRITVGSNSDITVQDISVQNGNDDGFYVEAAFATNYSVVLDNITVSGNSGSGVRHVRDEISTGYLAITDSVLSENAEAGLYNYECESFSTAYVTNTMITENEDAGIQNSCGHVVLNRVTVANNSGNSVPVGGIYSADGSSLEATNTVIYGNTGDDAGGLYISEESGEEGDYFLTNVTFANNISTNNLASEIYVTETDGTSAGILRAKNILMSNTSDDDLCSDVSEFMDGSSNNMATDNTCPGFEEVTDAGLAASLTDNGGSALLGSGGGAGNILSLALLKGSVAINSGANSGCPSVDVRDFSRPYASTCDVGAYESEFTSASNNNNRPSADDSELADTGIPQSLPASLSILLLGCGVILRRRHEAQH